MHFKESSLMGFCYCNFDSETVMKHRLRFHLNCVCSLEKCLIKCIVFSHNTNTVLFQLINIMVLYYTFCSIIIEMQNNFAVLQCYFQCQTLTCRGYNLGCRADYPLNNMFSVTGSCCSRGLRCTCVCSCQLFQVAHSRWWFLER